MNKQWYLWGLVVLALGAGCQKLPAPKPVFPAQGKVTLADGQPVSFGGVRLEPRDKNQGVEAYGIIKQDGTFQLRTYSPREPDGAVPGQYLVRLEPYDPMSGPLPKGASPTRIPKQYLSEDTSGLTVEIRREENNLKLQLK